MNDIIKLNSLISQNSDIDVSDLDGQKVMMNIELGKYFMLNEVGSDIWNIISEPISLENLVDKLLIIYDISKEQCLKSVKDYLEVLNDSELIKIS